MIKYYGPGPQLGGGWQLCGNLVGHGCPVGGPVLFHWACKGIGLQPILHCCPAKIVYGPVKYVTGPVKYFTWPVEISLGDKGKCKRYFHWPSEKLHHN